MRQQHPLTVLLENVLISGLPQGVKSAIDDCLAKGGDPKEIQRIIERTAPEGTMTRAACEAYLERKRKEGGASGE